MSIDYTSTCFVIMPFGTKPVGSEQVDFDIIYKEIFKPAVEDVPLPPPERATCAPHERTRTSSPAISARRCSRT